MIKIFNIRRVKWRYGIINLIELRWILENVLENLVYEE